MPQLKKISVLPSSIYPKIELGLENMFTTYSGTQDASSFLPIITDLKSSHLLSSEPESDATDSAPSKPRKRQRLDHLSQEEKIMRRKMKNRVAAQTARDRKKARMAELEDQVLELETERKMLLLANIELQSKNTALQRENEELKHRLDEGGLSTVKVEELSSREESKAVNEAESRLSDNSGPLEHAEGAGSANSYSLDDAIRLFTSNSETDDFLDLLQQCSEDLLQDEGLNSTLPDSGDTREHEIPVTEMVGATSKSLESHKELIHFDHIYYKQEDDILNPVDSSASESELSTKDSSIDIPFQLETNSLMEVENSEIPVICISESSNSNSVTDILQLDENFYLNELCDQTISISDCRPIPSPVSSDGGYDSSFSASSPCSNVVSPLDETLTELFPSLV